MYSISYQNNIIYDPRLEESAVFNTKLHTAVNEAGSFRFAMPETHPYLHMLHRLKGIVEVRSNQTVLYRGRIVSDSTDFYNMHSIETEGILACLNDSVIAPFDYPNGVEGAETATNTVAFFLAWVLALHNSQVTDEQKLRLGNVTVSDPNNYIVRSASDYSTSYDTIKKKLLDLLGGYLLIRYESDGNYIDYYSELPLTNLQKVEFGENLLNLSKEIDVSNIYTAILPIGSDGLTIEGEPDRQVTPDLQKIGKIIVSQQGVSSYGKITKVVKFDDVTIASNLVSKSAAMLSSVGLGIPTTIDCSAVDLGLVDDVPEYRVGRNTCVLSAPHGLSVYYPLMKLDIDLLNPASTQITLGATSISFTSDALSNNRTNEERLDYQQMEIEQTQERTNQIASTVTTEITSAVQNSQEIIFSALQSYVQTGDLETYQKDLSAELKILSDSITASVTTLTENIQNVNGELQNQISEITKYFRFDENGLWIGETGNEILLNLDNDIIQFLRNNYAELWLDSQGLHANQVVAKRINIGNVDIFDDNGRLTFGKAVS